jgi:hypothetical protein
VLSGPSNQGPLRSSINILVSTWAFPFLYTTLWCCKESKRRYFMRGFVLSVLIGDAQRICAALHLQVPAALPALHTLIITQ